MRYRLVICVLLLIQSNLFSQNPFEVHGRLRVSKSKTFLEHADGKPFFVLADTCWTGPALSTPEEWKFYLEDRKKKGFTAIQFNIVSPWSAAAADAEGNVSCKIVGDRIEMNEAFYKRLDDRFKAINDAGLLAMPVMCWAHNKNVDLGHKLTTEQATALCKFELNRYKERHTLWILAGDNSYSETETAKWKAVGRAVFGDSNNQLVTTHPTGTNWPWKNWDDEKWLNVLGYQSGHGDSDNTWKWIHNGPPAEYGKQKVINRPVMNLEPPYVGHNGYQSKKPHSDFNTRRATYWSLLVHPPMGVTYGGHGVWSWHLKPGEHPTGHQGTGPAKLWKDSLDQPGAIQMGYVRKLFESVDFGNLRPANSLLADQPGEKEPSKFIACAATADSKTIIVYTPTGKVSLKPGTIAINCEAKWFDPRTGETHPVEKDRLTAPSEQDWVLVVTP